MIVSSVKVQISLSGKFRYYLGITTGFKPIRRIREEGIQDLSGEHIIRIGESTLHLVIDDTIQGKFSIFLLHLIMPAFLQEDLRNIIDIGMKYRVHIDIHQVLEILIIGTCHRIDRLIRIGHRIEEGIERALHQFDKGILKRILL